jgi:hypothetical protein
MMLLSDAAEMMPSFPPPAAVTKGILSLYRLMSFGIACRTMAPMIPPKIVPRPPRMMIATNWIDTNSPAAPLSSLGLTYCCSDPYMAPATAANALEIAKAPTL